MLTPDALLAGFLVVTVVMVASVLLRPRLVDHPSGRLLVFVSFVVLPAVAVWAGTAVQLESSKTTDFCLSCHVMEPYGTSLEVDDPSLLAASHFQNHWVDQGRACYECHTSYTMYGGVKAKWNGAIHLWVNAFGTPSDPIELYEPYRNRDCLRCHRRARSFLDGGIHDDMMAELESDEVSCLDCHGPLHEAGEVEGMPLWPHAFLMEDSPAEESP